MGCIRLQRERAQIGLVCWGLRMFLQNWTWLRGFVLVLISVNRELSLCLCYLPFLHHEGTALKDPSLRETLKGISQVE